MPPFVLGSVRQVIFDVKIGPPSFEKDLAKDVMSEVGVYHPLIDKRFVQMLHGGEKKVYDWTVDDVYSMRLLFEGVDAIVTGHPSLLQKVMWDLETECCDEGFALP